MVSFRVRPASESYDAVVVGGAMMGSSVAWFLAANPGFDGRVLVVERDPSYANCSTAHTNSCMRQQFSSEINIRISQFAADYVKRFREEMDNVIAANAGTTAPQGVLYASGISAITPSGGAGAAQTVADYEGLMFGVKKQYRAEARPGNQAVFIGTETSYQRARSIVVSATDQRRVFGMETNTHEAYSILGHRYAINESLSNAQILFCCLNRYRLYRRQGFEVRVVTEDKELARKNQRLILVRARFGGKLELSGAATKITNGQA